MTSFKTWQVRAYNTAAESENKIHDDRVARRYGYKSALVPGVTVFSYLTHPAVVTWGEDWLDRGYAKIALKQPFYDDERVQVEPKADGPSSYTCELKNPQGEVCASGTAAVRDLPESPSLRNDPPAPEAWEKPRATRETLERLRKEGLGAVRVPWRGEAPGDRYTRVLDDMPSLVRTDQRAFAHPGFVLSLANRALMANVTLGPWIHVESEIQNFSRLALGRTVIIESAVADLFESNGHEFADLEVRMFLKEGPPLMTAKHRVIYLLRES